jgi:hypothetical protein
MGKNAKKVVKKDSDDESESEEPIKLNSKILKKLLINFFSTS